MMVRQAGIPVWLMIVFAVLLILVVWILATKMTKHKTSDVPAAIDAPAAIRWEPLDEPGAGGKIASLNVSPFDSQKVLVGGDMLGVGLSHDGSAHWASTFGFTMWEMAEFTFHPSDSDTIWAASAGGPYLSTDGGVNWVSERSGMGAASSSHFSAPIQKIIYYDSSNANKLLAFGGSHRQWDGGFTASSQVGAVWRSTDHGANWTQIATLPSTGNGKNIMSAYLAPNGDLYAAVEGAGVYKSTNQGTSWTAVNTGLPGSGHSVSWVTGKPTKSDTLYVSLQSYDSGGGAYSSGGIYKSVDGGANWYAANSGLNQTAGTAGTASSYSIVAVAPSLGSTLYTGDVKHGTVYKSTDNGVTWSNVLTGSSTGKAYPAGPNAEFIAIDPGDDQTVYVGSSETIFKTSNGGSAWSDATSIASGSNWKGRGFSGLVTRGFAFNPKDASEAAFVGMDAGKFWRSDDSLQTWSRASGGLENWNGARGLTFSGVSGDTIYATLGQQQFRGIGRSVDGGSTWVTLSGNGSVSSGGTGQVASGLPNYNTGSKPGNIYAHPDQSDKVWAIINGKIYKTSNGTSSSSSWTTVGGSGIEFRTLAAAKGTPLTFYATSDQGVYKTTDGSTFNKLSGFNYPTDYVVVDPGHPNVIYVTREEEDSSAQVNGLYKYDGSSWTRLSVPDSYSGKFLYAVDVDPFDSNRIIVAAIDAPYKDVSGAEGVFLSEDGGATWTQENDGLAMLRLNLVQFNPNVPGQVIAGTNGRGFFKGTLDTGGGPGSYVTIVKTATAPVIDGLYDSNNVWAPVALTSINHSLDGIVNNTANYRALWDANNLYFFIRVYDDANVQDSSAVDDDDGIEIYIDADNSKDSSYGSNDFEYKFRWNDSSVYEMKHSATSGVVLGSSTVTDSYKMEVKIPWSTLGVTPAGGHLIGFDIHVVDDDDGGTGDGEQGWRGTADTADSAPDTLGTLQMGN